MNTHYTTSSSDFPIWNEKEPLDSLQPGREEYERQLAERRKKHLQSITDRNWRPCLHDACAQCHGTGVKSNGNVCIHMISCPCPKCSPHC